MVSILVAAAGLLAAGTGTADDRVKILERSDTGFECVLTVPPVSYANRSIDGKEYVEAEIAGYASVASAPGQPLLPARPVYIGLPWQGTVSATVVPVFTGGRAPGRILPAPQGSGTGMNTVERYEEDPAVYGMNRFTPGISYHVDEDIVRNQRVMRINLIPLAYDPVSGAIRQVREYRINVRFSVKSGVERPDRHFEAVYRDLLLNYTQARVWRRPPALPGGGQSAKSTVSALSAATVRYKVPVTETGVYRITKSELAAAGLVGVSGEGLHLHTGTGRMLSDGSLTLSSVLPRDSLREVALYVSTQGLFTDDDYLLFYGTGVTGWDYDSSGGIWSYYKNHFASQNMYWLTVDHSYTGHRMAQMNTTPAAGADTIISVPEQLHWEKDFIFDYDEWIHRRHTHDYRDWGWLYLKNNISQSVPDFDLPGLATESVVNLSLMLGKSVNYDGISSQPVTITGNELPLGTLASGELRAILGNPGVTGNSIRLKSDKNLLEWFECRYQRDLVAGATEFMFTHDTSATVSYRVTGLTGGSSYWVFDTADPYGVRFHQRAVTAGSVVIGKDRAGLGRYRMLTSGRWKTVSGIRRADAVAITATSNRADYLMIVPDEFAVEAERLAAFHRSQPDNGIDRTMVVTLGEIYDAFAAGRTEPAAIRDFLTYTYLHWDQTPAYAVMVGDGHFNFKHIGIDADNGDRRNWMPVYNSAAGLCSDDWFVSLDWSGGSGSSGSNRLMSIGRLPVRSLEQLGTVIDKIISYEAGRQSSIGWRSRVVFIADDEYNPEYRTGFEKLWHVEDSEKLAVFVPDAYTLTKLYLTDYERDMQGMKPEATEDFIRIFNQGSLLFNYIGHGAPDIIAHESMFRFSSNHESIDNGTRMPVFLAFSCAVGQFDNYNRLSMGEGLMLLDGKGAIASIGATAETGISSNPYVNQAVFSKYFNSACNTLGQALITAKQAVPSYWSTARKYHLLGDPALSIIKPAYHIEIDDLTPDSLKALALTVITGSVRDSAGAVVSTFDGEVFLEVFDAEQLKTYTHANDASSVTYSQQGGCLFRGTAGVTAGTFSLRFMVPKDISYQQAGGKISAFATSAIGAGFGARKDIFLGGTGSGGTADGSGPEITLALKNYREADYGSVSSDPVLLMTLEDPSGINTAGAVGHGLTLTLDNDPTSTQDMTSSFVYDKGSYTRGVFEYAMFNLKSGSHVLTVKAWDSYNNSRTANLTFSVVSESDIKVLNPLNYPNPFEPATPDGRGGTDITYMLSRAAGSLPAIRIYTVTGRLVRELSGSGTMGYNTVYWDGRDRDGRPLANGTYMYVVMAEVTYEDGLKEKRTTDRTTGYAVIMR